MEKIYPTEIQYSRKMMAETTGMIDEDLESAVKEASSSDLIIVTGSFYLVGEALKKLKIKYKWKK
ncbi:MAG: hypothetical protein P8Y30_09055 [candidate division WOR-3 bacterium]